MIRVDVDDPDGVAAVQIYFQLQDKDTFELLEENNLPMIYETDTSLPHWMVDIVPGNVLGSTPYDKQYWFQFYFIATDKTGAQTRSDVYQFLVTYMLCHPIG
jgi:hypothetical protein